MFLTSQAHVHVDRERHLRSLHRGVLSGADSRYHQQVGDGIAWVHDMLLQSERVDNIILDLTDAGGPSTALYGPAFYGACSRLLATGGVLTLHVAAPWAQQALCAKTLCHLRAAFAFPYKHARRRPTRTGLR